MTRPRKNKIFDLFKSDFRITFFYKPTPEYKYYHIILDDSIEIKLKIINNVVVIDSAVSLTKSYIKPLFDKLVSMIMVQNKLTVLVSCLGTTHELRDSCIKFNAPIVDDIEYLTVPKSFYEMWKVTYPDMSSYGFYILSVSDNDIDNIGTENNLPSAESSKPQDDSTLINPKNSNFEPIKRILSSINNIIFESVDSNILKCIITEHDTFIIELVDEDLYIKDLLCDEDTTLNLVDIMNLISTFEKLVSISPNIYLINIKNHIVYQICMAKKYQVISTEHKLPVNKLFKQAFYDYGTYKILINN